MWLYPSQGGWEKQSGRCVQGKREEEQRWEPTMASPCGVTSRVGGKRGDGDRGAPGVCPQCPGGATEAAHIFGSGT